MTATQQQKRMTLGRATRSVAMRICGEQGAHGASGSGSPTHPYLPPPYVVLVEEGQVPDDAHPDEQRGRAQEDAADVIARQVLGAESSSIPWGWGDGTAGLRMLQGCPGLSPSTARSLGNPLKGGGSPQSRTALLRAGILSTELESRKKRAAPMTPPTIRPHPQHHPLLGQNIKHTHSLKPHPLLGPEDMPTGRRT